MIIPDVIQWLPKAFSRSRFVADLRRAALQALAHLYGYRGRLLVSDLFVGPRAVRIARGASFAAIREWRVERSPEITLFALSVSADGDGADWKMKVTFSNLDGTAATSNEYTMASQPQGAGGLADDSGTARRTPVKPFWCALSPDVRVITVPSSLDRKQRIKLEAVLADPATYAVVYLRAVSIWEVRVAATTSTPAALASGKTIPADFIGRDELGLIQPGTNVSDPEAQVVVENANWLLATQRSAWSSHDWTSDGGTANAIVQGAGSTRETTVASYVELTAIPIRTRPAKAGTITARLLARAQATVTDGKVKVVFEDDAGATILTVGPINFVAGAAILNPPPEASAKGLDGETEYLARIYLQADGAGGALTLYQLACWEDPITLADMP